MWMQNERNGQAKLNTIGKQAENHHEYDARNFQNKK